MNIIQEIQQIKETKQQIRSAIQKNGIQVEESVPFSEYANLIAHIPTQQKNPVMYLDMDYRVLINDSHKEHIIQINFFDCDITITPKQEWIHYFPIGTTLTSQQIRIWCDDNYGEARKGQLIISNGYNEMTINVYQEETSLYDTRISGIYTNIDLEDFPQLGEVYSSHIVIDDYTPSAGDVLKVEFVDLKTGVTEISEKVICETTKISFFENYPIAIKNAKILKNEKCVKNIITVMKENKCYMFDTISGTLYEQQGICELFNFDNFLKNEKFMNIPCWKDLFE